MRRLLRTRGFDVEPCTNPSDAVEILAKDPYRFDLVLLDVNMPGMTGLELLPKAKEIAPDIPVVMLTADDRASTAVAALKAGRIQLFNQAIGRPGCHRTYIEPRGSLQRTEATRETART